MLNREIGLHHPTIIRNREQFCEQNEVLYGNVVYQKIIYSNDESYDVLQEVGSRDTTRYVNGVYADALFTTERGVGLFLPVADCVATIVYDPVGNALALLHLGRHSTLTTLVRKTVDCFKHHGSDPKDILVWMSPGAKQDTYSLQWFDRENDASWKGFYTKNDKGYFLDLSGYNRQRCIDCGINPEKIFVSAVDTTESSDYFSHRGGDTADRMAVLAMMR